MGMAYKLARAKKKDGFIQSLLAVPGFVYDGTVPAVMRYPRRAADVPVGGTTMTPDDEAGEAAEAREEEALVA